jgi:hypothetical protein
MAQKLSSAELDSLLVPTFLRNLTQAQQTAIVQGTSTDAQQFRLLSQQLLVAAKKSFDAKKKGTCYANFKVPWTIPSGSLTINWCSLADYYCHLLGSPAAGFPFVFSKAYAYQKQQNRISNLRRNGKYCC